jgi:type IV pilus assembly protein PilY1
MKLRNFMSPVLQKPLILVAGAVLGVSTSAADLSFSNAPLFLESGVQPNIYFIIDDSGSMNWEVIFSKGAQDYFGYPGNGERYPDFTNAYADYNTVGENNQADGVLRLDVVFVPDVDDVDEQDWTDTNHDYPDRITEVRDSILLACRGINTLHYDPSKVYTPWEGDDENGNAFTNQSPNATGTSISAFVSPFEHPSSRVELLINEGGTDQDRTGYFPWNDANNNGDVDLWVDLDGDNVIDYFTDHNGNNKVDVFTDLNGNGKVDYWVDLDNDNIKDSDEFETETELECPDPEYLVNTVNLSAVEAENLIRKWVVYIDEQSLTEQTNFGNWFSYYRKRKWVSKRALSSIITDSTARMGINTIWNRSQRRAVKDVDDITFRGTGAAEVQAMEDAEDAKESLLYGMFDIGSSNGTPLRNALKRAGDYFSSTGTSAPILPAADGGSCQQNFTILFTDGVWNGNNNGFGNVDADDATNPFDGGLYEDSYSDTLADAAMYYYKNDLRTDLENKVPKTPGVDENDQQHLVTYTVAFGVTGNLDLSIEPGEAGWTSWPRPYSNTSSTIDDVRHAAFNGRGLFLNAQDPQGLIDSLNAAISDIQGRDASASAVSVNTGSISSTTMLFQAEFNSQQWRGQVNGIPLELDGSAKFSDNNGNGIQDDGEPNIEYLASVVPDHDSRTIVTYNGNDGVPFKWNSLSANQQGTLDSEDLVEYLRGDDAKELKNTGGTYRDREILATTSYGQNPEGPLGDIVNSSPAYVGNPEFLYPDNLEAKPYSSFISNPDGDNSFTEIDGKKFYRTPLIYVGANDGMLHAFDVDPLKAGQAGFGKEVFAYVPNSVMSRLPALANDKYSHQYTVDGTPYVGDAFFDNDWHSVLVAGLNAGGQGIYALDVSNPNAFSTESSAADKVLWEFTDSDDSDLGYTFGVPTIAKANNGDWVAIFGNGYNNTVSDGNIGSGTAVLYIVNIETGALIKKIDTGRRELSTPNGLSAPSTVDYNGDYKVDAVYAGDLEGNMWKFDLSSPNPANWDVAFDLAGVNQPLFTACDGDTCTTGNRQPITVKPQVGINKGATGYMVYFGTGTYMLKTDNQALGMQTFYGIWDRNLSTNLDFDRSHLLEQQILQEVNVASLDLSFRVTSKSDASWHSGTGLPGDANNDGKPDTHLGWYMDMVNTEGGNTNGYGERIVSDPVLRDDSIIFVTTIPDPDPCSYGGTGWYMELNAASGSRHEDGVIDTDGDGDIDENDVIQSTTEGKVPVSGVSVDSLATSPVCITLQNGVETCKSNTSNAEILEVQRSAGVSLGRWMWREL